MFTGFTFSSRLFLCCFVMFSACACSVRFCLQFEFVQLLEPILLSVVSRTAFCLLHVTFLAPGASFSRILLFRVRDHFGSGSQLFKEFVSKVRDRIWAPGPSLERILLLMVQDSFGSRSQFFKKMVIKSPGLFWLREPGLKKLVFTVRDDFGSGSQFWKKIVINGPGPFLLREPGLKEDCYYRSRTILATEASFERRLLLMVQNRFGSKSQLKKKFVINGLALGASFKGVCF